ncbi:MAG TPA: hypothetical protein VF541_01885, partial [Longimicrobium sp.]
SLLLFIIATFRHGLGFDRHPRVGAILADPALAPGARMHAVLSSLTPTEWEEARGLAAAEGGRDGVP